MTRVNGYVKGLLLSRPLVNESYSPGIGRGGSISGNVSTFVHEAVRLE